MIVDARNYLNVYIYEKWNTRLLPNFVQGETFTPTELTMKAGRTSAPSMLREADLIALMDANGIGRRELTILARTWKRCSAFPNIVARYGRYYP